MRAYRLVKARHQATALDGSGAKAHGGRWNSQGVAMVYASDSVSLAALELLVHLHRSSVLNEYRLFRLDVPDGGVMWLDESALPSDWRADPPPSSTAAIGDEWIGSGLSLALSVPSTLVPTQRNLLLNPAHDAFDGVIAGAAMEPFSFDPRLAK
jgi:RES domain-containing protein